MEQLTPELAEQRAGEILRGEDTEPTHAIVEVTYSKGVTIQMRDYEPCNIHISAKAALGIDTPETRTAALKDMEQFVKAELINEQTILLAQRKEMAAIQAKQQMDEMNKAGQDTQNWIDTMAKPPSAATPEEWPETAQPTAPATDPNDLVYINEDGKRDPHAEIRMQEPPF